jgi:hypothetical protein
MPAGQPNPTIPGASRAPLPSVFVGTSEQGESTLCCRCWVIVIKLREGTFGNTLSLTLQIVEGLYTSEERTPKIYYLVDVGASPCADSTEAYLILSSFLSQGRKSSASAPCLLRLTIFKCCISHRDFRSPVQEHSFGKLAKPARPWPWTLFLTPVKKYTYRQVPLRDFT